MASVRVSLERTSGYQVAIDAATTRGVNTLSRATARAAHNTTPVRTGRLLSSIRIISASKVGTRQARGGVEAAAPYAAYVHEGTGFYAGNGYIRGNPMRWTNAGGAYAGTWQGLAVRGQPAQPFLAQAYNIGRLQVGFIQPVSGLDETPPGSAPGYDDAVQQVRKIR